MILRAGKKWKSPDYGTLYGTKQTKPLKPW